jgi:hypothetical protein
MLVRLNCVRSGLVCADQLVNVLRRCDSWDGCDCDCDWELGWYPELLGEAMKSNVSTASASIAAFWEGVRWDEGRVLEESSGWECVDIACQAASFGVGRRRDPGMMSAGGARER